MVPQRKGVRYSAHRHHAAGRETQPDVDKRRRHIKAAYFPADMLDDADDMGGCEIVDQSGGHAGQHGRSAREQKQGQDQHRDGAEHDAAGGIEQHGGSAFLHSAGLGRRLRLRAAGDAEIAGGAAQFVDTTHELRDGADLLLDDLNGVGCRGEPVLRGLVEQIRSARHHAEQQQHEQHGAGACAERESRAAFPPAPTTPVQTGRQAPPARTRHAPAEQALRTAPATSSRTAVTFRIFRPRRAAWSGRRREFRATRGLLSSRPSLWASSVSLLLSRPTMRAAERLT